MSPDPDTTRHLRLGMIGLDTSHSVEFASRLNDPAHPDHVPGARIEVAFKTFSADMSVSHGRVDRFAREMQEEHGVRLVGSLDALLAECDAVLLCSIDGRPHLEQFKACAKGRPVFVDKPVAGTLRDALEIYRIAEQRQTPVFSASALRFEPEVIEVALEDVGRVAGAVAHGPAPLEPHHPDLFFYGIHATEALFTVMGPGCRHVSRVTTERASVVTGVWADGSIGTLYAMHHWPAPYKVIKMGDRSVIARDVPPDYAPLLQEIVRFCRTKVPPVSPEQTLEIYAFMEAADESRRREGASVAIEETMRRAQPV
jgi:hypothetical protein